MRAIAAIVAALCALAFAAPADAVGLTYCDNIKNDQDRMTCLQQHISNLEQTILALSGRIATLENALGNKVSTDVTYKIQSVDKDGCIGLDGDPLKPSLVGCDHPDAWKMVAGPPVKKPEKPAPPPTPEPQAEAKPASTASPAAAKPGTKQDNPCRGLAQMACVAKRDICDWKADEKKCGKKP
jgi:hypothetical protein